VAWPLTLLLILFYFKVEIKSLVTRVQRISPSGADFSSPEQRLLSNDGGRIGEAAKNLAAQNSTPAVKDLVVQLESALASFQVDDKEKQLLVDLAVARLDIHFAFAYQSIFGSQIELLKRMKNNNGTATKAEVEHYFQALQDSIPEHKDKSVDEYLNFLASRNLISKEESTISLSPWGYDFLLFLFRYNLPENRLF